MPDKALFKHATQAVAASVTTPQNPGCPVEATAEQIRQKGLHTKFYHIQSMQQIHVHYIKVPTDDDEEDDNTLKSNNEVIITVQV